MPNYDDMPNLGFTWSWPFKRNCNMKDHVQKKTGWSVLERFGLIGIIYN